MLSVRDPSPPKTGSVAYRGYSFDTEVRSWVKLSFSLIPVKGADICVALFRSGQEGLLGLFLGPHGSLSVRSWSYRHFPNGLMFPYRGLHPKKASDNFPPRYPSDSTLLYPSSSYPSSIYPSSPNHPQFEYSYPSNTTGEYREVLARSSEPVQVTIHLDNLSSSKGAYRVHTSRDRKRPSSVFGGSINWKNKKLTSVLVGCVLPSTEPYDLSLDNLNLDGEFFRGDWINIADYQGFRVEDSVLWQGSNDFFNTSEYTDIRNLARYDYARPSAPPVGAVKGVKWRLNNG